jgi:hypothetical protein
MNEEEFIAKLKETAGKMQADGIDPIQIQGFIDQKKNEWKAKYEGKMDAAAEETATVVADQPSELGLQSENGLSEQRYSHPDEDRGFFDALIFEPLSKGIAQGSSSDEAYGVFLGGDFSPEALKAFRGADKKVMESGMTKEGIAYEAAVNKRIEAGENPILAYFKELPNNKIGAAQYMIQSQTAAATAGLENPAISLTAAGAGALATGAIGSAASPVGTAIGAGIGGVRGFMSGSMLALEGASRMSELAKEWFEENNLDWNKDSDWQKLKNDEAALREIKLRGMGAGLTIGAAEYFGGKIGGKLVSKAVGAVSGKVAKAATKTVGSLASEATVGGLGEAGALGVMGRDITSTESLKEIGMESVIGIVGAPITAAQATLEQAKAKNKYIVNGGKTTDKSKVNNIISDASDKDFVNIKIKSDDKKVNQKIKSRREKIIKEDKNLIKNKVEPQVITDQKKKLDLAIQQTEIDIANIKEQDDSLSVLPFETRLKDLKDKRAALDEIVQYQLDELNEQESMDLMDMDDDISLYQSIINDPMSAEAAKKEAQKQLDLLKVQQVQTFMNPSAIDTRNPSGPKNQKNIDLSQKTQEAYEGGDIDGVIKSQQGLISSIATSLWSRVPKEKQVGTYEGFKAALVTSKGGMLDMINSYSPEKFPGVPLAAYLGDRQKGLRARANRIIKELTKQDFEVSTDSTEVLNSFSDIETNIDDIDIYGPKYNSQKLGLGTNLLEEASKDVELATQKIENELAKADQKAKPLTQKQRQSKAEKDFDSVFKNKYVKRIKDKIGKKLDKEKYIRNNVTTLKKIALANRDFQKGNQGIAKDWNKYPPSDQAFIDYYMGTDTSNIQAISDRKKSLAEAVAKQIGKDAKDNYFEGKEAERAEIGERLGIAYSEDLEVKKIRIFDFDDTLAKSNSQVLYTLPDGTTGKLNATEYAKRDQELKDKGATFDFSEFSKVIDGKKGPLFEVAQKINAARGNEDLFVLTARPEDSAGPIQEFLKLAGLDFKKENIIGLGDGTAQAKANWVQGKIDEGYNDFYFADDAIKNVEAVKQVLDNSEVKSKVQQAKVYQEVINDIEKELNILISSVQQIGHWKQNVPQANVDLADQPSYNKYIGSFLSFIGHKNTKEINLNNYDDLLQTQKELEEAANSGFISLQGLKAGKLANFGKKVVIKDPKTGEFISKATAGTRKIPKQKQERYYELSGSVEGSEGNYYKIPGEYVKNEKGKFEWKDNSSAIKEIEKIAANVLKPDTSKGSVYWSSTADPAYLRLEKAAKENYKGQIIEGSITRIKPLEGKNSIIVNKVLNFDKFKKLANDSQPQVKINQRIIAQLTKDFALSVKSGINPYVAGMLLKGAYQSTEGGIKASYEFKWMETGELEFGESEKYTEGYRGNKERRVREEHSPPASVFMAKLVQVALTADVDNIEAIVGDMYQDAGQFLISFKHDEMLDNNKLGASIVEGSYVGRASGLTRILSAGIPARKLINKNGNTIADLAQLTEGIPNVVTNEAALDALGPRVEQGLQSAVQMQEDLNPNPELSKNEAVEALSDMLGTIYGVDVITTKKALEEAGYSEADVKKALRSFGFEDSQNGYVFINSEKAGLDTPMHEFTHVWANLVFAKDPELFNAIYDKLKSHPRYNEAISRMSKGGYANIPIDSFGYKNEVMAYILGEEGKSLYQVFAGDAEAKSLIDKFFDYIREALGFDPTVKNFADLNVDQVVKLAVKDIMEGNPSANFNKLQNVAEGKSWYAKAEAAQSPSAKAKADPLVRAFNKLKLSYRTNKDLARAINDAYAEVEGLMSFMDFVKLVSKNTKEIKTGKTNQLLIAKAEIIKADKIAEENAKKQAEDKVNEEQASKLQSMFRRIIYQAKGEGAKASRWFIPPNAEDFKGLLYAFLPKGQLGVDARKWMEEHLIKPYSNGIATLDTEILHKSKAWTDMSKGFNFEEKIGGTPYTLGDAIKVYNALKEGVDPGIAKKKHLDALIHAVESNSEVLNLANEVAESFPIKLESGWQTRAFAKEIYDSINNGARKRHLETFSNNVDAIFTDATLDLIADQYGEKYRQAIVSTLRRMKSGRNRVSTDANANVYMNWLNRAVGTTMFLNTRSAILQLLSTLNFIGKPGNNIFQATAAFANQKQWKADYNKLWNSDYLTNRRDGAKFDVLADEIAEGPQGLNKILKFGFLPTRYADSFAIALGGAAYYRNRVNMLMKEGMSEADAEAQAMIDWRNTAEESQQSSDPSKISEIQASAIGKIIYAFANTPFQYARITKRKLQDIASGRSAAAGTLRTDMQSILYYSVGQAIMFNALQSGLVALLNSDDPEDDEMKKEKYALLIERTLTSFAKSTGNPGAVASTLYAMMKEGYMQQTGQKRPDANAFAITATSISPPLNSKIRDLAGAYRAFNKIDEDDVFTPSLDNEALTMAGEVASFGGIPLDRVIRKARHLAAIKNEEAELWQKIWMLAGWSSWELGVKENKDAGFKAIDFKDVDFKEVDFKEVEFKEPAFKKLKKGVAGEANRDGTIEVDPNLSPVERAKTIAHEEQHVKDMKSGVLDYDDNFVYYNKNKYERKNGKIIYKGKSYIEGDPQLPWEKRAYNAEPSTKEVKRKKLYA